MSNQLLSSKVAIIEETPSTPTIQGVTLSDCGMVTTTERGPVAAKPILVQGFAAYKKVFGSFTADSEGALAAQMFFDNGGTNLWVSRTVHFTDPTNASSKTSAAATGTVKTAALAATAGTTSAANKAPYNLTPGQTVVAKVNGGGALTATFNATAASVAGTNAETFNLTDGWTIALSINGAAPFTVTFHTAEFASIAAATAAEVAAVIQSAANAADAPLAATADGGHHVVLTTTTKGTGSSVTVEAGGTALTALGFTAGTTSGTGNVASINAVTGAEVATVLQAAFTNTTVTSTVSTISIATNTVGSGGSIQVTSDGAGIGFDLLTHTGSDPGSFNTLTIDGKTDGAYGNQITNQFTAPTNGVAGSFNYFVLQQGAIVEVWPNLNMIPSDPNYIVTKVNDPNTGSDYVQVTDLHVNVGGFANAIPAIGTTTMSGGSDGLASLADADFVGNQAGPTGFRCLDQNNSLRLLICPGQATPAVHNGMLTYCEAIRFGSMFAILDPPASQTATEMVTYVTQTALLAESSEFGAIYWPQVKIANPNTSIFGAASSIVVPPSPAIAGTYGRNDASKPGGIYEAPAGMDHSPANVGWGQLLNVLGLETDEVKDENKRDLVYPVFINPIVGLDGQPIHLDGAKTLSDQGDFPTIGERRGVIYIEQSLKTGLLFGKHRKIKASTLARLRRATNVFLLLQTRQGAFASDDPKQAYSIDFGAGINLPSDALALTMNGRIGLATAKPGEFIVVRVGQDTTALEAELAALAA